MGKLQDDVEEIRAIVSRMEGDLKYHIKRTDLLEAKFEPVEDHVKFIRQLMRLVTWCAGLTGAAALLIKILRG